ncbi:YaaL family protein [Ligilactobacillus cholophilus]|uniref:YaaL family protein n=1 Tax=Ligilactobacillus cholophilus TaxID=3050131 RepID=UPI0025AED0E2|nr:YaaL family protein [Ligilactobacillus cholophilus]
MFGFKKRKNKEPLKKQYDRKLLADIETAKNEWDGIRTNDDLLATMSTEDYLVSEELARAKFEFLFREAKARKVKAKIQESVIVR